MNWRSARFGAMSDRVASSVAAAVQLAHLDASGAHDAGHMRAHDAYGNTMKVRVPEILIEMLGELDGIFIDRSHDAGRFALPVVEPTSVAIMPVRIGRDRAVGHEGLRLRTPVSEVRRSLLTRGSEFAAQLVLDPDAEDGFSWHDPRGRRFDRVVVVAYGSSPKDGVWDLGWGDLELVNASRGEVVWHHWEPLTFELERLTEPS